MKVQTVQLWIFMVATFIVLACVYLSSLGFVGKTFPGFRFEPDLIVSPQNLPYWAGSRAGLAAGDGLDAIGSISLSTPTQVWHAVRRVPAGTRLRYRVHGHLGRREIAVATAQFSWADWSVNVLPSLVIGTVFWGLGVFVLRVRSGHPLTGGFVRFTGSMAAFLALNNDYDFGAWFGPLSVGSAVFLGASAVDVGLAFACLGRDCLLAKRLLAGLYFLGGAISLVGVLTFAPVSIGLNPHGALYRMLDTKVATVFMLLGVVGILGGLGFASLRPASVQAGQQARISLFGACLAFVPGTLLWLVPDLADLVRDSASCALHWSVLCLSFFPLAVAVAIVRTRLFDLDRIVSRSFAYGTSIGALAVGYALLVAGTGFFLTQVAGNTGPLADVGATVCLAAVFSPLRDWASRAIDALFHRTPADVAGISRRFVDAIQQPPSIRSMEDSFAEALKAAFGTSEIRLDLEEMEQPTARAGPADGHIAVPLVAGETLVGRAILGPRVSEQPYRRSDMALVARLGSVLAWSIQTLRLAERLAVAKKESQELAAEMAVARRLHSALLPPAPTTGAFEVGIGRWASSNFGRNLIEVVDHDEGKIWFAMGQASSHGLTPSLMMMIAQTSFGALIEHNSDDAPGAVLAGINRVLFQSISGRMRSLDFIGLVVGKCSTTGEVDLAGANGAVMVWRADTHLVEYLAADCLRVGVIPEVANYVGCRSVILGHQDVLAVLSEGMVNEWERRSPGGGLKVLTEALASCGHLDAGSIKEVMLASLPDVGAPLQEDPTVLILRRPAARAELHYEPATA